MRRIALLTALALVSCSEPAPHSLAKERTAVQGPPMLVAIGERVEVRAAPQPEAPVMGALRAGAIIPRRAEPAGFVGCAGGWYAIEPRGFVCRGESATLERQHRIARALHPPELARPLPYRYARSRRGGAVAYHVPPSPAMQRVAEPYARRKQGARAPERMGAGANDVPLDESGMAQGPHIVRHGSAGVGADGYRTRARFFDFGRSVDIDIGTELVPQPGLRPLARAIARAAGDVEVLRRGSGVALAGALDVGAGAQRRRFGVTPSGRFVPVDGLAPELGSPWHGIDVSKVGLPVAFALRDGIQPRHLSKREAVLSDHEEYSLRQPIPLTGRFRTLNRIRYYEARNGSWVRHRDVIIIFERHRWPDFATGTQRWIDVSLATQTLVAYHGRTPVYATLVSSGRDRLGDPEQGPSTPQGVFRVREKHVSREIDNREVDRRYRLMEVPWVIDLEGGPSLVGSYWLDHFGDAQGWHQVALSPIDARFLFHWMPPRLPAGWHSVLTDPADSTIVYLHK